MGRKDRTSLIISLLACQQIHPLQAKGNVEATSFSGAVIIVALSVEAPIEKGGVATPLKALRPGFADEWVSDLILSNGHLSIGA